MEISRRGFLAAVSVPGIRGSEVPGFRGSGVPEFRGSEVPGFQGPKGSRFQGSEVPPPGELPYLSIREAAALLRSRKLSPVELTKAVLDRIDRLEPRVHAFITIARDEALAAARVAEREIAAAKFRSLLHGIPFGVKDTHYTKGIRTTANTPVLSTFVPDFDATVVARLKQAGGVLIGKLNLPEFSFGGSPVGGGEFADAANPWDLTRTPGGSSSGSGAALAAGLVLAATGGDTSGSIRNPAALCGVVGMKPTYGRVSRHGIVTISWSLDHVGPMTRTVYDNALLLNLIAGHDPLDASSSAQPVPDYTRATGRGVRGMRIGMPKPAWLEDYHKDVKRAFDEALGVFRKLGAMITAVDMPPTLAAIDDVQTIVRIAEAASYHESFLADHAARYGKTNVRRDVEAGSLITATQYLRAQKVRARFVNEFAALFGTFDVFLTPGFPAPAGEPDTVRQPFRRVFNVCGFPALVLPCGLSTAPAGLPISLQIAARPFGEEAIYSAAAALETATAWHLRRPSLS
jgi:aspartyl-tRNA(Asn)/glutamyl-tRNA(Gln) amidotransferase subunit A